MNDLTDQQLLRDYAEDRSEAAFTELVRRHIDLVHSAAFRLTGEAHSAQDVTQGVFLALAQNAVRLTHHPVLAGWLHTTARNLAAKNVRATVRRQNHEQEAAAMNELLSAAPEVSWEEIAPHLDAALGELSEPERNAVLLRYFERKSAGEIGGILGISDEAAQKRVSSAVERLREFFAKRGVAVGTGGLVAVISAYAVQAAPTGLAVSVAAAAIAGTAVTTATAAATTAKIITMTTLQKTLVTATVAVLAGAGIYEARQVAQLRDQVQALQQQQAPLAEQIRQFQAEREDSARELAALRVDYERSNRSAGELLKLRGELARLRRDSEELARLKAGRTQTPGDSGSAEMNAVLARVGELKQMLNQKPDLNIPELQFLTSQDWLNVAAVAKLDTDSGARAALSCLRSAAKLAFAPMLEKALTGYVKTSGGQLPAAFLQLKPYFDPPVEDALLDRYQLLATGKASDLPVPKQSLFGESAGDAGTNRIRFRPPTSEGSVISEKAKVDEEFDSVLSVGLHGSHLSEEGPVGSALDAVTRTAILQRRMTRTNN